MISVHSRGAKRVHLADVLDGIPLCGARLAESRMTVAKPPTCPACVAVARDRKDSQRHGAPGDLGSAPFVSIKIARGSAGRADFQVVIPYGASKREIDEVHRLALEEYARLNRELR